jgi:MFS family permease
MSLPRAGVPAYPAWRLLAVLMAMNLVAYLDRSILSLAAPAIRVDLGLSHVQLSLLLGFAFIAAFVVLGIPFGWLIDRVARRRVVMAGVLTWSLSASSAGLAASFAGLLAARLGVGAGEAVLNPAAFSMLTDAMPRRRLALALTLYGGSSGLGAAISVGVGGLLLAAAAAHGPFDVPLLGTLQPWQLVLVLSGLPGLLIAPLIFTVPEPPRLERLERSEAGEAGQGGVLRYLVTHWRFYLPVIAGFSMLQITSYAFSSWQPTYMVQRFGWNIADVGSALSIGMVGSFLGAFVAGWAVDALAARGVVDAPLRWAGGAALWCGTLIATAFIVDDPYICIGLVIVGQLPIAAIGVVSTAMQQMTPNDYRGRISALFLLFGNLIGFGIGPLAPAMLTDYIFADEAKLGLAVALVTIATGPIAALLLWLGCGPMRRALHAPRHSAVTFDARETGRPTDRSHV